MSRVVKALLLSLPLICWSAATTNAAEPLHGKSLYDRLGGKKAITAVVDEFVGRVGADDRINAYFAGADLVQLKAHLVNQICQVAGGPCKYTGQNMKAAHTGMMITTVDFNALVEDLVGALDKFKVGEKEKGELLGVLGPMKGDIVTGDATLYGRLGSKAAITAVVAEFVGRVGADTRINGFFAKTNLDHLKKMLVDQICQAAGGPCKYTGRDMKTAHAGMGVTDAAFGALVEDLVAALDKFKVGEKEKNELLGVLGPMKTDIVESPAMGNK